MTFFASLFASVLAFFSFHQMPPDQHVQQLQNIPAKVQVMATTSITFTTLTSTSNGTKDYIS